MKKGLKRIFLLGMVLLLTGCGGSSGVNSPQVGDASPYGSGASSRGLGQGALFDTDDVRGERYSTRAPSNQVYLFAFDNSHVAKKYLPSLEAQARYLSNHPKARVLLAGHTDQVGSREYNVALGERRALAVSQMMRLNGARKDQIRVVSYGKERPVAFEDSEVAHKQNRRVELIYEAVR